MSNGSIARSARVTSGLDSLAFDVLYSVLCSHTHGSYNHKSINIPTSIIISTIRVAPSSALLNPNVVSLCWSCTVPNHTEPYHTVPYCNNAPIAQCQSLPCDWSVAQWSVNTRHVPTDRFRSGSFFLFFFPLSLFFFSSSLLPQTEISLQFDFKRTVHSMSR